MQTNKQAAGKMRNETGEVVRWIYFFYSLVNLF